MTVVAGLVSDGVVYMGADRGASDGDSILSMNSPKIAKVNNWLIGYAGSGGLGQIVQHLDCWKEHPKDVEKFLRMVFVEEYIKAREKVGGKDEEEAQLLIGYKGQLYEMDTSDYAIFSFGYTAIGSGGAIAIGSLFTTQNTAFLPQMRVELAIKASINHNPACNGPIDTYIC